MLGNHRRRNVAQARAAELLSPEAQRRCVDGFAFGEYSAIRAPSVASRETAYVRPVRAASVRTDHCFASALVLKLLHWAGCPWTRTRASYERPFLPFRCLIDAIYPVPFERWLPRLTRKDWIEVEEIGGNYQFAPKNGGESGI